MECRLTAGFSVSSPLSSVAAPAIPTFRLAASVNERVWPFLGDLVGVRVPHASLRPPRWPSLRPWEPWAFSAAAARQASRPIPKPSVISLEKPQHFRAFPTPSQIYRNRVGLDCQSAEASGHHPRGACGGVSGHIATDTTNRR